MDASTYAIAAPATPPGRGALAVIRLTGDGTQEIFAGIIAEKEKFRREAPRRIGVYIVVDTAHNDTNYTAIDEVTAVKYDAPHSYTGEEMVEIFCHGGAIIPTKILEQLFRRGARAAERGEFSRRALVNGKIGILKAESIRELIESQTETRLRSAQLAYFGKQSESIERLKREIIAVLSDIESRIEFDEDDDVAESRLKSISANRETLESIVVRLKDELRRSDRIKALDDGIIVTIAGPANAGKSSLFNEILGYDRSIVHDRPGTTRDVVSERLNIDGVAVKLFDSAGIRETGDAVERIGMDRTRSAVAEAHAVLWVTSAAETFGKGEREGILGIIDDDATSVESGNSSRILGCGGKILVVINKIDLPSTPAILDEKRRFCEEHSLKYIETSLTEKINRHAAFDAINATIRSVAVEVPVPVIIVNERHRRIVVSVIENLRDCVANFDREEVAAHYLKSALDKLADKLGHVGGDEVLDEIFGKFCIGK